ncbi:MAG: Rib/alpha-like domain-containing protein, partial [Bacillota bacterium]|nr:Rib/alpha-like domain-containing protein [Bacillota bacterium]
MERLEKMKAIIQKKNGTKRHLRYGTRKLSVGIVSCLLGYWVCITPAVALAADIQRVEVEEAVVTALETGNKEASGNIDAENIGYAPNGKYNFQDLKFNPMKIEKGMQTNQLGFEIYGKHNIAASTDNWKIRLQIDERLAKYIKNIEVDAKSQGGRRTLVRQSDTIGRKTNIWEVNYVRANSGLFAGGETTDTQVAPNGIITFEKNIDEIMAEIGDENVAFDELGYRIYLISVKDGGKIIPGIDSTGSFRTYMDTQMSIEESPNNTEWFKYAAIGARYIENEKMVGANGAIVVDHNISKNKNFAYGTSAKETPWKLQFKIDKRLVKYVDGIELHKMGSAGSVAPDFSLENKNNVKVADLSIERSPNKENYGMGEITDNDLRNIVEFNNASPRPTVIRYVYKLNKPINEILEELKKEAGVEEGNSFGKDFDFDAWISDINGKLITNTWGSGYYRIQDVDGDGKVDDSESNKETSPYISAPTIKSVYEGDKKVAASVLLNENAGKGNVAVLVNKDGEEIARVENLDAVDEYGAPKTILKEFTFSVTDAEKLGKAGDELTVKVIPSDQRYQEPEIGKAVLKEAPTAVKTPIETYKGTKLDDDTEFAKNGIANKDKMPEGTIYSWKTIPDTKEVGDTTGVVLVKVPDREEAFEVIIPVSVVQGLEITVKTPEKQTEGVAVKENTKVIAMNQENAKVTASHDEGNNTGLSINQEGNLTGIPENFVWGDKDSSTYEEQEVTLHAVVQSEDGKEEKTADVIVTVQRDTDKDGVPDVKDDDDDNDGIKDQEEIDKGSDPKDPNSVPQTDIKPVGKVDITNATQTVVEGNAIQAIEIKAEDEKAVIEVGELLSGLSYDEEKKIITGTPEVTDWGNAEEERVMVTKVKVTNEDGSSVEKEVKITVQKKLDAEKLDAEKYEAQGGVVNKMYGQTATPEEIIAVVTTDAPEGKVQSIEVTGTIPTEGTDKNVSVAVTYADGSS